MQVGCKLDCFTHTLQCVYFSQAYVEHMQCISASRLLFAFPLNIAFVHNAFICMLCLSSLMQLSGRTGNYVNSNNVAMHLECSLAILAKHVDYCFVH